MLFFTQAFRYSYTFFYILFSLNYSFYIYFISQFEAVNLCLTKVLYKSLNNNLRQNPAYKWLNKFKCKIVKELLSPKPLPNKIKTLFKLQHKKKKVMFCFADKRTVRVIWRTFRCEHTELVLPPYHFLICLFDVSIVLIYHEVAW